VAAALAVFILYTSIAGAGTPQIVPTEIAQHHGEEVTLVGTVRSSGGDAHSASGLRFALSDPQKKTGHVDVVYHGTVPDLYRVGREVVVAGTYANGSFTAKDGTLSTKCPSKYTPAKNT
jgi:cytochrome c-type biogenesis protein CcmE